MANRNETGFVKTGRDTRKQVAGALAALGLAGGSVGIEYYRSSHDSSDDAPETTTFPAVDGDGQERTGRVPSAETTTSMNGDDQKIKDAAADIFVPIPSEERKKVRTELFSLATYVLGQKEILRLSTGDSIMSIQTKGDYEVTFSGWLGRASLSVEESGIIHLEMVQIDDGSTVPHSSAFQRDFINVDEVRNFLTQVRSVEQQINEITKQYSGDQIATLELPPEILARLDKQLDVLKKLYNE